MEVNTVTNLINSMKVNQNSTSTKFKSENKSEKFSETLANASKENSTKDKDNSIKNNTESDSDTKVDANNGISKDSNKVTSSDDKEVKVSTENEEVLDKDSVDLSKVSDLVLALLSGKIDFNQFQEELNNASVSSDVKATILQIVSALTNSKEGSLVDLSSAETLNELKEQLKQLINEDKNTSPSDLKSVKDILSKVTETLKKSDNNSLIETLQSVTENITEKIDDNKNDSTLNSLLATRFLATNKTNVTSGDSVKKAETKVEDILSSLTQKKSENNDTAMLKISGLINSINNNSNQPASIVSEQPMTINKATINEDIIKSIKFMNLNQIKELTVKINPKELGEVVIKIVADGNTMKATIQTSNKEAFNLLNSQVNELTKSLQDIKIQGVTINISQEDTTFFAGQFNGQSQNKDQNNNKRNVSSSKDIGIEGIEETNDLIIDSNINALA
ncbi:MAG: flagellar hook-length control protein FliK [Clostridiaceae bacterium]